MEVLSQHPQQDQSGSIREMMIIDTKKRGGVVQIQMHDQEETNTCSATTNKRYMFLLGINYMLLFVGSISSSLLSKFYFNHKGNSRWVSTWVQSAGFPFLLVPIYLPFYVFKSTHRKPFTRFTPKILLLSILIGFLLGLNNLFIFLGQFLSPLFTLISSVIIVKQKITYANLNCVILLTLSSVLLALGSNHDKPKGLTRTNYFIGFFSTIGAGLLFALYLPVMEKVYKKVYCYSMVVEMQMVMELAATVLATLGMTINGGFSEMKKEGENVFDLGEKAYWLTVMFNVVTWQFCFMGTAGMVFMTTLMSLNVLDGVIVYGDNFGGIKLVSTLLCIWGFSSYLYGMYMKRKEEEDEEKKKKASMEKLINNDDQQEEVTEVVTHKA
ncbi:unnamed protein product [Withania somnifera]